MQLRSFTCAQLRAVCRSNNWTGHSGLRKVDLVQMVRKHLIDARMALVDHSRRRMFRPCQRVNERDPITLAPLDNRRAEYLLHLPVQGNLALVQAFCPMALVRMILTTGKCLNVLTREQLTASQMRDLEHLYVSCLRLHPDTPTDPTALLAFRPDLDAACLSAPPTREDLGLELGECAPGPIHGFAPWIDTRTLLQRAAITRTRERRLAEHNNTSGFLADDLNDIFTYLTRALEEPGASVPVARRNQLYQAVLHHCECLAPDVVRALVRHDMGVAARHLNQLCVVYREQVAPHTNERRVEAVARVYASMLEICTDAAVAETAYIALPSSPEARVTSQRTRRVLHGMSREFGSMSRSMGLLGDVRLMM